MSNFLSAVGRWWVIFMTNLPAYSALVCNIHYVMPLKDFTPGWKIAHIGFEGAAVSINGINPWGLSWKRVSDEAIIVPHPSYPTERHTV